MYKINFSHNYNKFPDTIKEWIQHYGTRPYREPETKLIEVLTGSTEDLSQDFKAYDTKYTNEYPNYGPYGGAYELPRGKILILLLLTEGRMFQYPSLWTTIRRYTIAKEIYYRSIRGQVVHITRKDLAGPEYIGTKQENGGR